MCEKKKLLIFGEDNFDKSGHKLFDEKANELFDKYNINKLHAECYLVNYKNNYVCQEYNGGCDGINTCRRIDNDCNRD